MEKENNGLPHNLSLDERKKLYISAVEDVLYFNEEHIHAVTSMGEIDITGNNLKIQSLNKDTGELFVDGTIGSLSYTERREKPKSFFERFFK